MTIRTIAWFASEEIYESIRKENRSEWMRTALLMYMDTEASDSIVRSLLPEGTVPRVGRKVIMDAGDEIYSRLSKLSVDTGEPMYSIATKAAMYRHLFEETACRAFTIRLSEEEVHRLSGSGRSIADSIHAIIGEASE